jgi:hypothetical protein
MADENGTPVVNEAARPWCPAKIVSGGQTGVDRAALDVALALGIACGGWCPRGRLAEDGVIPSRYPLTETPTSEYPERTRQNVLDSDATLIFNHGPLAGGTALTRHLARELGKPNLVMDPGATVEVETVRSWCREHRVRILNVAGPRESHSPGIGDSVRKFLSALLSEQSIVAGGKI